MSVKLLLIDDSPTMEKIFQLALAGYQCELHTANTVANALAMTHKVAFDLIMIDAGILPPAEYDKVQNNFSTRTQKLIILSSVDESKFRSDYQRNGLSNFLVKPFESAQIHQTISQCLGYKIEKKNIVVPDPPIHSSTSIPDVPISPPPPPSEPRVSFSNQSLPVDLPPPPKQPQRPAQTEYPDTELINKYIESYCRKHFHEIAEKIIREELAKLDS